MWFLYQEQYDKTRSNIVSRRRIPIAFPLVSTACRWHDGIFPYMPINPHTLSSDVDPIDFTRYTCVRAPQPRITKNKNVPDP